ncbi:hypothetical protein D3C83_141610 [compost metagenome]
MDGHDAGGEVAEADLRKTRFLHHAGEFFLWRVLANAFGQVAVTVGIVGNQAAERGQHVEGVAVVRFFQARRADR